MNQSAVLRLTKQQADVQKSIASQQDRLSKMRRDTAKLRQDAAKTKSASIRASKLQQAESKEREVARAEKRLSELYVKKSNVDAALARNLDNLRRAQGQQQRRSDAQDKHRRQEELRHFQEITRQVENQSRLQASVPRQLPVDAIRIGDLPKKIIVSVFAANPRDTGRLSLDEEVRLIEEKIRASRGAIELRSHWATRPDDLLQSLNQDRPHIVHFSGHLGFRTSRHVGRPGCLGVEEFFQGGRDQPRWQKLGGR